MVKKKSKKDENGLIVTYEESRNSILKGDSWVYTDSLSLADVLNTEHKRVLERIRNVLKDYRIEDGHLNCQSSESTEIQEVIHKSTDFTYSILQYKNSQNKLQPYYKLSKDLLILVIFSFRKLEKAQELQLLYIAKFNAMEMELNWYKARYLGIVIINDFEFIFDFREVKRIYDDETNEYNDEDLFRVAIDSGGYSCGHLYWVNKNTKKSMDLLIYKKKSEIKSLKNDLKWAEQDLEKLEKEN